ncbi:MAG: NAD-dependent epimerase/dehydratase family protein, partial [Planctomycetia bacterium]|nr:NAD-dependent epimerase/dehydratase family protein [Planctomycetia bacterium]
MRFMITGAGGFIGGAIAKDLVASGHEIVTFQRGQYPHLDALGGTHVVGDLNNLDLLAESMRGCDGVFHVAALAAISGDPAEFEKANMQGTQNIITACRRENIGRLVFTSSPSVVFSGEDQNGINESTPYPDSYLADYPRTKAIAEKLVLDNCDASLSTIAIRPHLVWGPGDRHLYPRIVDRAKNGKLKLVRRPGMKIDACYIENAVSAHVLAMTQIAHNVDCRGKAYFISNDEPIAPEELINQFLECANLQRITPSISPLLAKIAGYL